MCNEKSKPGDEEKKPDCIDAKELFAFFGSVAIVFALITKLFFISIMDAGEIVYGLTFSDESIELKSNFYNYAVFFFVVSLGIATLCKNFLQKIMKKLFYSFLNIKIVYF